MNAKSTLLALALVAGGYLLGSTSPPSPAAAQQDTALMRQAISELSNIRRELSRIATEIGRQR